MGLDAGLYKIKDNIVNSKQYNGIRQRKFKELHENYDKFYEYEKEILYTSDWALNTMILDGIGSKDEWKLVFEDDLEGICKNIKQAINEKLYKDYEIIDINYYKAKLNELIDIWNTIDFSKETLLYQYDF